MTHRSRWFALSLLLIALGGGQVGRARELRFTDLAPSAVQVFECPRLLATTPRTRLADLEELLVVAWNVDGVNDAVGRFSPSGLEDEGYQFRAEAPGFPLAPWKFRAKQNHVLRAGELSGLAAGTLPHVVIASEVESILAAERLFNEGDLAGRYRTFLARGNDTRGIDIAFAVRADLDVDVDLESHVSARWFDTVEGRVARVFTRDLPVLILRDRGSPDDPFVVIGHHGKSMRDRAGGRDPRSKALRSAQAAAAREIIELYRTRFDRDVPMLMAGDFNAHVPTAPEIDPLREILTDAFDVVDQRERTTHTYHPNEATVVESQLDAAFVSEAVKPFVASARVLPEFHHLSGERLGVPQSLTDRLANFPSDHRAVAVVIRAADMYRARRSR